jgi:type IV secretion system protein TrbE
MENFYVFLPILTGALCLMLAARFLIMLFNFGSQYDLKRFRKDNLKGMADLLTYGAMVNDGVILGKNGSFMAAWEYAGSDIGSVTDSFRNAVNTRINKALSWMGSGWMIHVDSYRFESPSYSDKSLSHFSAEIPRLIDEGRRDFFESIGAMYDTKHVITLTWFPPDVAQKKFIDLMLDDNSADSKSMGAKYLTEFENNVAMFETKLSNIFNVKRLKKYTKHEFGEDVYFDSFLEHLHICITGNKKPVRLPEMPVYLDHLIGCQDFFPGINPKIGNKFVQVVAIEGFPSLSGPGELNALTELSNQYRWSTRYIFLDRPEAISVLEKFRGVWKQREKSFISQVFNIANTHVDEHAAGMVVEGNSAIADLNEGGKTQGYYTSNIIIFGEDSESVANDVSKVSRLIDNIGFTSRVEKINAVDAFLGSLPGHGVENVTRPLIDSINLASLLPVNSIFQGEETAPCPMYEESAPPVMSCITRGNSKFNFNFHVRDVGHTFIFGPTGSGKSTLSAMLNMQFQRYKNAQIFVFDKGLSIYPACVGSDGTHYDIGNDNLCFAPLSDLKSQAKRMWALEWIDNILSLNGLVTTPEQRNEIARSLTNMADNNDSTISDFVIEVQDLKIKDALKQYTVDGLMGNMLDSHHDNISFSSFTCFEIEKLMDMGDKFAMPVLLYLFMKIESALDGRPSAICISEAWLMFSHGAFKERFREWLKTLRKKNCIVVFDTQSISDAARSGILDVIIESCPTKIFLPNPNASDPEISKIYGGIGLNEKQIKVISEATPKNDYYCISEKGCALFSLALGPIALAFVGKTGLDSIKEIKELRVRYGNEWKYKWLERCGVNIKGDKYE